VIDDLQLLRDDRVATLRLNRPRRRNAFTLAMVAAWRELLLELQEDDGVSVIVLTGAGDSFCSGIDLDELRRVRDGGDHLDAILTEQIHGVARALEAIRKPVIAAIRGAAVGAGMDMALMCDLRIADRTATFCERYIDVGIMPGDGAAWMLPRLIGVPQTLRLLWTADMVNADEASRLGIVDLVVDDGALEAEVDELVHRIAAKPPRLLEMMKTAVRQAQRQDFLTSLNEVALMQRTLAIPDA
jgi:enoyl-CoA hydratase/carnithine racemase